MAIKRMVYEVCQFCGQQQARIESDGSISLSHHCKQSPPGPPNPPKRFRPDEVIFVPKPVENTK